MFNIGAPEALVIMFLALVVLGPQRLPEAAKQIGKFMGEARKMSSSFQNELKTAFDSETETAARKRGAAVARPTEVDAAAAATAGAAATPAEVMPTPPSDKVELTKKAATNGSAKPRVRRTEPLRPTTKPPTKKATVKKAAAKKATPAKKAATTAAKTATATNGTPVKKASAKRVTR